MPDLERIITKVFSYSVKNAVKAIYFENVSFSKLRELKQLLKHFRELPDIIDTLRCKAHNFKSERLKNLVTFESEGGMMPWLEDAIS